MPRNAKSTARAFHTSTPTIFEKKNGFSKVAPIATVPAGSVGNPSLGQVMKEGFAFGAGSSIARMMIESAFSRMSSQVDSVPAPPLTISKDEMTQCKERGLSYKCDNLADPTRQAWVQCMKDTKFDDSLCDTKF